MSDLPGISNHDLLDGAYARDPEAEKRAAEYVKVRLGDDAADVLQALGLEAA